MFFDTCGIKFGNDPQTLDELAKLIKTPLELSAFELLDDFCASIVK